MTGVESFTTRTGSAYELDLAGRRVRRLGNAAGKVTTPRQGRAVARLRLAGGAGG
jgi:hypothetical protein